MLPSGAHRYEESIVKFFTRLSCHALSLSHLPRLAVILLPKRRGDFVIGR